MGSKIVKVSSQLICSQRGCILPVYSQGIFQHCLEFVETVPHSAVIREVGGILELAVVIVVSWSMEGGKKKGSRKEEGEGGREGDTRFRSSPQRYDMARLTSALLCSPFIEAGEGIQMVLLSQPPQLATKATKHSHTSKHYSPRLWFVSIHMDYHGRALRIQLAA